MNVCQVSKEKESLAQQVVYAYIVTSIHQPELVHKLGLLRRKCTVVFTVESIVS